jgi:N-acetylmuramoyl-L-alanine amidase
MRSFASALVAAAIVAMCLPLPARAGPQATNAATLFREARTRETAIRREIDARRTPAAREALLERARTLVHAYDDIARLFPRDRYADDAVWQGATLAADVFWEFGETADRDTALRLLKTLATRYPSSTFAAQVTGQRTRLGAAPPQATAPPAPGPTIPRSVPNAPQARLTSIRREVMPGALRLVVELDAETAFHDTQLDAPTRLLLDLHNAQPIDTLRNATRMFQDDVVRRIQVTGIAGSTTRLALDLSGNTPHTTYALYNPYRVVIDFAREATPAQLAQIARPARAESAPPPQPNTRGGFSLSRQLGLGVARVVIDPGHGGHDPGAMSGGLSEADLVLDVALRLERLLLKQPGVQVVLTRRSDIFVPLEERTALANREEADLFLSIHGNASGDDRLQGVETYFLNFAPNPAAEAVAARENAASTRTMGQLPDILKAIALNNKLDESRDFASLVQSAMLDKLKRSNKGVKDLGVKQAPFTVLVGATMPSVLSEISFLTNKQDAALLRGNAYRQQIAEALFTGVMSYQRSLKATTTAGAQP